MATSMRCKVAAYHKSSQVQDIVLKSSRANGNETLARQLCSKSTQEKCTKRTIGEDFELNTYVYEFLVTLRVFKPVCGNRWNHHQLKSTNFSFMLIIFCSLLCVASAHSFGKDECDPNDPSSCSFGATCQKEHVRGHRGRAFYRCKCPQINCYSAGLYDPVCGDDGIFQKPYFNVLCIMLQECEMQQSIRQVCSGICGTPSCKKISPESMHHGPCPRKDANLCLNGGLCVHHKILDRSSCRCPAEYTGDRCESKIPPPPDPTKDEDKVTCDSTSTNFLTIFAIVLLGFVLLFIIVCMCCRNRQDDKEEDPFWPSSRLELDETTPLRENTRSDYLFPEKSNETTESTTE
ncbi:uncharacterized protein LOC120328112 [Styela clava]